MQTVILFFEESHFEFFSDTFAEISHAPFIMGRCVREIKKSQALPYQNVPDRIRSFCAVSIRKKTVELVKRDLLICYQYKQYIIIKYYFPYCL